MMEHSVYYVASPEACAAILWKTRDATPKATEALRITSSELLKMGVCDAVVPEPEGAAHADPLGAFDFVKTELLATIREFKSYATEIAGKQVGAGVEVDVNEASADPSSIAMQ